MLFKFIVRTKCAGYRRETIDGSHQCFALAQRSTVVSEISFQMFGQKPVTKGGYRASVLIVLSEDHEVALGVQTFGAVVEI